MTSIDFSKMWSSAKKKGNAGNNKPVNQPEPVPKPSDGATSTPSPDPDSNLASAIDQLKKNDVFMVNFANKGLTLPQLPTNDSLYYLPNFITPDEEQQLLKQVRFVFYITLVVLTAL